MFRDILQETAVQNRLNTTWLGQSYTYFTTIGSTNDRLKEMILTGDEQHPAHGTVLLTDFQSAGRGRLGRRWEAPSGSSLLMSMLFRPNWPAEKANWLTMLVSLAVAEVIAEETAVPTGIKWPNDIVVLQDGVWHKVCGLLLEGDVNENGRLQWGIVGMGINVNLTREQLPDGVTPPTSLQVACGQPIPRLPLLVNLLTRIEMLYETAVAGQSPHPAWNAKLVTLGQTVTVTYHHSQKRLIGLAESSSPDGALLIRDAEGMAHSVIAGDVTLRI